MGKMYEITQTQCECVAEDCQSIRYNIRAHVETYEGIGQKLKICIQPPINNISEDEVEFDNSRLPEKIVEDWFIEHISQDGNWHSIKVISSDSIENEIIF